MPETSYRSEIEFLIREQRKRQIEAMKELREMFEGEQGTAFMEKLAELREKSVPDGMFSHHLDRLHEMYSLTLTMMHNWEQSELSAIRSEEAALNQPGVIVPDAEGRVPEPVPAIAAPADE